MRWQKDAKNQIVTMSYDVLGRMTGRVEAEGTSTWTYDQPGSKGIGKLWQVAGPGNYSETYIYDPLGRPSQTSQVMKGNTYTTATSYDGFGRVSVLTYPSGFQLKHNYNTRGYLDKVINAANTSEVYWTAREVSADGQITSELLGNGVQTVRGIDPASGRMIYLGSYAGATNVQMLTYQYDALGNLKSRDDAVQTLNETFQYDAFNRLKQATIAGVGTKTWNYNGLGNITAKDGYTDYAYGTAGSKPHAVTAARGNTYSYDANGNLTGGAGRIITWDSANLPTRIVKGNAIAEFKYGPDRARYQQVSTVNGVSTATLYVGKLYEQSTVGTQTTYKNYIHAGGRVVAIRETVNSTSPTTKYLHQDHLGSTDVITSSTGQVLERQSFDAFGTRRVATTWRDPVSAILGLYSTRGFTGHEQLDTVGLIHMNGRVYDPELGRFISADPTVQAPGNGQSLNRYSYVVNNPLRLTDPTGYDFWEEAGDFFSDPGGYINDNVIEPIGNVIGVDKDDFVKYVVPLVAVVVAPWAGLYVGTTYGLSTAAGYAVTGFTAGFIASGGDARAGLIGAATGGLYGVGGTLGGMVGSGVNGYLQTGDIEGFARGFASSGFTSLAFPAIGTVPGGAVGRTVAATVVGGTASELGGGKFANGAKTFGYLQMFGEAANYYENSVGRPASLRPGENRPGQTTYRPNPDTGQQYPQDWDMNIVGNNDLTSFCRQGSMCSKVLNVVPLIAPTAGLHDLWFNVPGHPEQTFVTNYGTMPAAAAITTGAVLGNFTRGWSSDPMLTFYLIRPRD